MKILVLGAGVIGVSTAWFLSKAGHDVTVLDRQDSPGKETSFANGGQISAGQAEPWANPAAPAKIVKWLGREDAPLLFRLRADASQWSWGLKFLLECLPSRTHQNTLQTLKLAVFSREKLKEVREETGLVYDGVERGILTLHTDQKEFKLAQTRLQMLREHGVSVNVRSPSQVLEIEPALKQSKVEIVGATHAEDDESGDAFLFTQRLAEVAGKNGVAFGFGVEVIDWQVKGSRINSILARVGDRLETFSADAFVVALGSYTTLSLSKLGINIPVFPVKGYSVTIPISDSDLAPEVCITDENGKVAISRLGRRLRAAGTAELAGYDLAIREERCQAIVNRVREFFPSINNYDNHRKWTGLRPAVPSNVPLIGRLKFKNLFVNTGQGTLGWTLACGSGAGLANVISAEHPGVDFPFLL